MNQPTTAPTVKPDPSRTRSAHVAARPEEVWEVLARFDRISAWAPDVNHSTFTTDRTEGVGTARRVQVGRMALIETVTVWQAGNELAYTIEGLPPLVRSVTNHWRLQPGSGGTQVSLTTTIDPGGTPKGRIGARILGVVLGRAGKGLVAGLVAEAEKGNS